MATSPAEAVAHARRVVRRPTERGDVFLTRSMSALCAVPVEKPPASMTRSVVCSSAFENLSLVRWPVFVCSFESYFAFRSSKDTEGGGWLSSRSVPVALATS